MSEELGHYETPIVKGGQGRTREDVTGCSIIGGAEIIALILTLIGAAFLL